MESTLLKVLCSLKSVCVIEVKHGTSGLVM